MKNELMISSDIKIDINDLVLIAVAEAEKQLRTNLKQLQSQITILKDAINKKQEKYIKKYEKKLEEKVAAKRKNYQNALKLIGNSNITIQTVKKVIAIDEIKSADARNTIQYTFAITSGTPSQSRRPISQNIVTSFVLSTHCFKPFPGQIKDAAEIIKMEEAKQNAAQECVEIQQKMSNIPAFERQMRAKVAHHQLSKNSIGRQMINSMLKNFNNELDMIG